MIYRVVRLSDIVCSALTIRCWFWLTGCIRDIKSWRQKASLRYSTSHGEKGAQAGSSAPCGSLVAQEPEGVALCQELQWC